MITTKWMHSHNWEAIFITHWYWYQYLMYVFICHHHLLLLLHISRLRECALNLWLLLPSMNSGFSFSSFFFHSHLWRLLVATTTTARFLRHFSLSLYWSCGPKLTRGTDWTLLFVKRCIYSKNLNACTRWWKDVWRCVCEWGFSWFSIESFCLSFGWIAFNTCAMEKCAYPSISTSRSSFWFEEDQQTFCFLSSAMLITHKKEWGIVVGVVEHHISITMQTTFAKCIQT